MRFDQIQGRSSLPITQIQRSFRNEDVITVLVVESQMQRHESLLVAMLNAVAIVTGEIGVQGERWMTQWAPWDAVNVAHVAEPEASAEFDAQPYRLTIRVGSTTFWAEESGETGRRALRDFVVATRDRQHAIVSAS